MLRHRRDIWLAAGLVTMLTVSVVTGLTLLRYPRDVWAAELSFNLFMTVLLSYPLSWYMGLLVVRNAELNDALQKLLDRDRLTEVATRDFFFTQMAADPTAYGISLIIDIDNFKRVNDSHGHLAGDHVINRVARVLRRACRQHDIVCRFGGEEFVIFLKETPPDRGADIAERIRAMTEEEAIFYGNQRISVTVSIGGALKERTTDIEASIQEADVMLYRAKNAGRNRTRMSWQTPPPDFQLARKAG